MEIEEFVEIVLVAVGIVRPTAAPAEWAYVQEAYAVAENFTANQRAIIARLWTERP